MKLLLISIFLLVSVVVRAEEDGCPSDLTVNGKLPDLTIATSTDEFRIYVCDLFEMFAPDPVAIYRVFPKYDEHWFYLPTFLQANEVEKIPVREFSVPNKFEQIFSFTSWTTYSNPGASDGVGYLLEYKWQGKYGTLWFGNPDAGESKDAQMFSRLISLIRK